MILVYFLLNLYPAFIFTDEIAFLGLKNRLLSIRTRFKNLPENSIIALLRKMGCNDIKDVIFYTTAAILMFMVSAYILFSYGISSGLMIFLASFTMLSLLLYSRKMHISRLFQKNAYRLYKYIYNLVNAGVLPKDALISMHEIIEEKQLKEIMVKVCARYSATLDPVQTGDFLLCYIDTDESRNFVTFMQNEVLETRDKAKLNRLESLMFNRYFAYVQRKTDGDKTKCMITVILLSVIIVAMILIPLFMDVQDALNSIFLT